MAIQGPVLQDGGAGGVPFAGGGRANNPTLWNPPGQVPAGASSAAGPFGNSPVTNPLVGASGAPMLRPNHLGIPSQTWTKIHLDRASVFWPLSQPAGVVYYAPDRIPDSTADALTSFGAGLCFLAGPGDWWIYCPNALEALVIDAFNPGRLSDLINQGGCHTVTSIQVTPTAAPGPAGIMLNANRNRTALLFQQTSTSIAVRFGFGTLPTADGLGISTGLRLAQGVSSTLLLTGQTNYKGFIYGISETTSAGTVNITEFT